MILAGRIEQAWAALLRALNIASIDDIRRVGAELEHLLDERINDLIGEVRALERNFRGHRTKTEADLRSLAKDFERMITHAENQRELVRDPERRTQIAKLIKQLKSKQEKTTSQIVKISSAGG